MRSAVNEIMQRSVLGAEIVILNFVIFTAE